MVLRPLIAGVLLLCLFGCTSNGDPSPRKDGASVSHGAATPSVESADAHEDLPVGAESPLNVYAHCGFKFTRIDGVLWQTRLRGDGQGNPPAGWPNVVQGTVARVSKTRAIFRGTSVRVRATFRPAPNAKYACA